MYYQVLRAVKEKTGCSRHLQEYLNGFYLSTYPMKICCKCIYARTTEYDDILHKTIRRSKILHVLAYEKK